MDSRLIGFADHYWSEYMGKIGAAVAPTSRNKSAESQTFGASSQPT